MGFFAAVMLSVLFLQDTRKDTWELLHTRPVKAGSYVAGKILGGFAVCLLVLAILNVAFWILCMVRTRGSGFEVRLQDFLAATCLYIVPNMLMIVCVYCLISLLFRNPLPAMPLLILYMVYSNMGSRNAEGLYGFYGRPLAIMVRFPGAMFDTTPPPMAVLAAAFCADTYVLEIVSGRSEVWRLYPVRNRMCAVGRRMVIQELYLLLLAAAGYGWNAHK